MLGVVDAGERLFASHEEGAGPHAVTTAGTNTYTYDANGSMISGAGRTTAWTSFNKPQNISDSLTSNWTSFVYGPSRARIQQNAHTNGITTTTDYVGGSYERRSRLNQPDELVHYIRAGGGTVAIYTKTDDGNALTDKTRYLHKDHLGSVEIHHRRERRGHGASLLRCPRQTPAHRLAGRNAGHPGRNATRLYRPRAPGRRRADPHERPGLRPHTGTLPLCRSQRAGAGRYAVL